MGSDIAFHDAVELLGNGRGLALKTILLALERTPVLADFVGVLGGVGEIVFLGDLELELTRCTVLLKDGELALGFVLDIGKYLGSLGDGIVGEFGDTILASGDETTQSVGLDKCTLVVDGCRIHVLNSGGKIV